MLEKGPEKLLEALQDVRPVGHFGAPGGLSWDLRFARRTPLDEGGERVVLVANRPIGFREATNHLDRSIILSPSSNSGSPRTVKARARCRSRRR